MKNNIYEKSDLIHQLRSLGVQEGDTLLVRASLGAVGRVKGNFKSTFMDALLESVGDKGTLISLGFTPSFLSRKMARKKENIFSTDKVPNIGALAKMFHQHPNRFRSCHPTNSYIAIGRHAEYFVSEHDEHSLSYTPISKLLELNGKMLIVGCVKDSPGFTTVHYAQEKIGLTKKSLISWLQKVYFMKDGQLKLFTKTDTGGCSAGFRKFYADYIEEDKLKIGHVGEAQSLLINAVDSYTIESSRIRENNKYFLCDNNLCLSCRATWTFNLIDMPKYLFFKILTILRKKSDK